MSEVWNGLGVATALAKYVTFHLERIDEEIMILATVGLDREVDQAKSLAIPFLSASEFGEAFVEFGSRRGNALDRLDEELPRARVLKLRRSDGD